MHGDFDDETVVRFLPEENDKDAIPEPIFDDEDEITHPETPIPMEELITQPIKKRQIIG